MWITLVIGVVKQIIGKQSQVISARRLYRIGIRNQRVDARAEAPATAAARHLARRAVLGAGDVDGREVFPSAGFRRTQSPARCPF